MPCRISKVHAVLSQLLGSIGRKEKKAPTDWRTLANGGKGQPR
jgi:hypothetical protein